MMRLKCVAKTCAGAQATWLTQSCAEGKRSRYSSHYRGYYPWPNSRSTVSRRK